jgi:antitoxin YefM
MPDAVNYTEARKKLASIMDRVTQDHDAVIITRQKAEPVVVMSLADYNSIQETAFLLRSPKNAERLRCGVADVEQGRTMVHDLIED